MEWWHWFLIVYGIGIPIAACITVALVLGSGGYVIRPSVLIACNAVLWPVALPVFIGMYLQSRG